MADRFDVIVVGAGAIGMAGALALAELDLDVALIAPAGAVPQAPADAADWDARVFALSPGSRALLERLRIWPELPAQRIAPIYSMQIRGPRAGTPVALNFEAYQAGIAALAYTVENRALTQALAAALRFAGIRRIDATVAAHHIEADCVRLDLDHGESLESRLLVAADGANSALREQAAIESKRVAYRQTAVVANFRVDRPHLDSAYQWFSEQGVIAWLPLGESREPKISLVWSAPDALADELIRLSPAELADRAAQAGQRLLGAFEALGAAQAYPLSEMRAATLVGPRLALIGDAGHLVHPLAGQGMNLGFQDVSALVRVIGAREPLREVGDPLLLRRYQRSRREAVLLAQSTLDGLHRMFYRAPAGFGLVRDWGWRAVESSRWLKRQLIAQAAL